MMLFGLRDATTDSTTSSVLDSIPGVDLITNYIENKAKTGAEGAIPDIQNQVKAAITPYIFTLALVAGIGALFGISAYMKVNKLTARSNS